MKDAKAGILLLLELAGNLCKSDEASSDSSHANDSLQDWGTSARDTESDTRKQSRGKHDMALSQRIKVR